MVTTGRLVGWRLSIDHVDPLGSVTLASSGGPTLFARGVARTLPTIFAHRDVGNTDCPGHAAYAAMGHLRQIAARFNEPRGPANLAESLRGGAIHARWESLGGMHSFLGAPKTPEATGAGTTRYVPFEHGAIYWSPQTGANPVTGAIYDAWAWLGYERGALGLPTSAEIPEAQWIKQNFQHGTLNFQSRERQSNPGDRRGRAATAATPGGGATDPARAVHPDTGAEKPHLASTATRVRLTRRRDGGALQSSCDVA